MFEKEVEEMVEEEEKSTFTSKKFYNVHHKSNNPPLHTYVLYVYTGVLHFSAYSCKHMI